MKTLWLVPLLLFACSKRPSAPTAVWIDAILYDGFELANADEIVVLRNISQEPVDVGGWRISDNTSGTAVIPPRTLLPAQSTLWLTKNGTITSQRFRKVADFELEDSHPLVANLLGTWPSLTDSGDTLYLLDDQERTIDVVVYKAGTPPADGWIGTSVKPIYTEEEGIFLLRVSNQDSDQATDWTQTAVIKEDGKEIGSPMRIGATLEEVSP